MKAESFPTHEEARVAAVHSFQGYLPIAAPSLEALVRSAAGVCGVPIAAVTLIDMHTQCFAVSTGLQISETPRDIAFCAHTILNPDSILEVHDATLDDRFRDNPMVTGNFGIRFYAGAPIFDGDGNALGALCVVDTVVRSLSPHQRMIFKDLAQAATGIIQGQLDAKKSADVIAEISKEHFNTLESAPVGMMRISPRGKILFANQHLEEMFDVPGSLFGETVECLVPSRLRGSEENALERYIADVSSRVAGSTQTLIGVRADGQEFPIEVALTALSSGEIVAAVTDVSEREKTRALEARLADQQRLVTTGTLASGVGHEINNPLSFVQTNLDYAMGELETILGKAPSAELSDILGALVDARSGTDRIRRIVLGLRTLARTEQEIAPLDVNAILDVSSNMAMHEIRSVATLDFQLGHVPNISADDGKLTQVFVNLLVNAAQAFCAPDPEKNRIQVRTFVNAENRVCIEIEDNGDGIPEDVLGRIFDPFFTTKPVGVGTGLGLAISHSLVTALDGTLEVRSTVGKGTVFRLTFARSTLLEQRRAQSIHAPAPRAKILVIDDEKLLLTSVERILRREHELELVSDPRVARKMLLEDAMDFDLVFCDVMMPFINGFELYDQVRSLKPNLANRFVFMTASWATPEVQDFLARVDNECLEKPLKGENLSLMVQRALRRQQKR